MSMQFDEFILFPFTTFIATLYPVILFIPKDTEPKPPSPKGLII